MTYLNRRDQIEAQRTIQNLAPQLANRGTLRPDAARQMCDGFVTPQNLRQAEDAMQRARNSGDGRGFQAASALHDAINVAMAFQDPRSTLIENRNDKIDDFNGGGDIYGNNLPGNGGIYGNNAGVLIVGPDASNAEKTGAIVGLGLAAALLLMSRNNDRNDRRDDYRRHR